MFILLVIPLQFSNHFFMLIGLNESSSAFAQRYMDLALPGILFGSLADSNRRLMNSMGYQTSPMLVQLGVSLAHYFVTHLLIYEVGMGIDGPALAVTISNINLFIFTFLLTEILGRRD